MIGQQHRKTFFIRFLRSISSLSGSAPRHKIGMRRDIGFATYRGAHRASQGRVVRRRKRSLSSGRQRDRSRSRDVRAGSGTNRTDLIRSRQEVSMEGEVSKCARRFVAVLS
ncbi:MAG: hypothetical protein KA144_16435, partial [Xanthomonadaceae bacterium]|nr:hypothetical protein [Xanthomonadaceae bacterium]